MKRYEYNEVKTIIEKESKCKLLSNEYKNVESKLNLLCECGEEFVTTFEKFLRRNKRQCNKCGRRILSEQNKDTIENIKNFVSQNSKCELVSKEYIDAHQKLSFKCECGELFEVAYKHFKNNNQRWCPKCSKVVYPNARKLPYKYIKEFIEIESGSGCKLLDEKYNSTDYKLNIQCACGNSYKTSFDSFKYQDVRQCSLCRESNKSFSKGEWKIEKVLIDLNTRYEKEYSYKDLKFINLLRFDFAILDKTNKVLGLIEFDGKQHFGIGGFSSDKDEMERLFQQTKIRDEMKNNYCLEKNIRLLRIPYYKYRHIEKIVKIFLEEIKYDNSEVIC